MDVGKSERARRRAVVDRDKGLNAPPCFVQRRRVEAVVAWVEPIRNEEQLVVDNGEFSRPAAACRPANVFHEPMII